ncbi:putative acyl-CoA dehydrogenase FadE17 [Frankia canadensis]|uniref:Putative acyl-CoA dehydrogenase FadE17 n=1 Tax=Frankia canadensis TaxID=1836972 RepID=A0A2I2KLN0_9ACTN|nr:acyl-CoA dehydrogenase family protein [Frankia canadensis]SNQ46573.1 putative acyl-CoA dehydrogenase FadE17 [Frankia canadensis]SOU53863.1 putative acyl-CoA dehydrogenase FadE17 [Frankia canadensis]
MAQTAREDPAGDRGHEDDDSDRESLTAFLDRARVFLAGAPEVGRRSETTGLARSEAGDGERVGDGDGGQRASRPPLVWGEGSDEVNLLPEHSPEEDERIVAAARRFKAAEYAAGFGWIDGPTEYGGAGLPVSYLDAYLDLRGQYDVPDLAVFGLGLGMISPTLLAHGSESAKRIYLPRLHAGEAIGCQLFSEPGAGSDLASLRTRAVRDGDEWVITGQKVWTTNGHLSDVGEVLCRTSPEAPKHRGITAFLVDMHAPGVEVRPLRQMTGGASFNEVFLTEVRVPDENRLGAVDDGWRVATTTLMNERSTASDLGGSLAAILDRLIMLARWSGRLADPVVRDRLSDTVMHVRLAGYATERAHLARTAGTPGPEHSVGKLVWTNNLRRISDLLTDILGPRLIADTGEWGTFAWTTLVLGVPGIRVSAGTDEIMKNILAERVLGLPREPSPARTTSAPGGNGKDGNV